MPVQRDLAHADSLTSNIVLNITLGNANIGDTTIAIDGNPITDAKGKTIHFKNSFHYNLGPASNLTGKEIEVFSTLSPNPAIADKTLILTYDLFNATFLVARNRTLTSTTYTNNNDTFDVSIQLL
jgi:hypothetical protein